MKRLLVALAAAAALLTACGPSLEAGAVAEKLYDDPDTWTQMTCTAYGKYGCTTWVPITHYDGAHYSLRIEEVVDGKKVSDEIRVSPEVWDLCTEGRRYPDCATPGKN